MTVVDDPGARSPSHVPVMLRPCLELLAPALANRPDALAVDATLGLGGHAAALLDAHPQLTLVGLDRDPEALRVAARRLERHARRTHLVHAGYDQLPAVLARLGLPEVHAVLFDLCLLYTSPSPRDRTRSRMPSSA